MSHIFGEIGRPFSAGQAHAPHTGRRTWAPGRKQHAPDKCEQYEKTSLHSFNIDEIHRREIIISTSVPQIPAACAVITEATLFPTPKTAFPPGAPKTQAWI
ncbi:hypothetical protein [Pseudodesulfovibrio senegalensis]|uniref:hypothetical protein n=1 Tax=Pseudodesulfovibrio senegalensis TaxID=1721087 RepID=UPI001375FCE0|nr:hypothetical protein [Pseudodesulfovibrio senegalensis]